MKKGFSENIQQTISKDKGLAYVDDFKDFIRDNPGFIQSTHEILKNYDFSKDQVENNGVVVTRLDSSNLPVKPTFPSFKVQKGNQAFFVKLDDVKRSNLGGEGLNEFMDTQKAKELLRDLPWVEVANSQLGYKDDKYAYFVSKWNDLFSLSSLDDYMEKLELEIFRNYSSNKIQQDEMYDLKSKIKVLENKLPGYFDIFPHNMAYDPKSKKIYIFDLNRWD